MSYDRYSGSVYVADTNNHCVRVVKVGEKWPSSELAVVDRSRCSGNTGVSWMLKDVRLVYCYHGASCNSLIFSQYSQTSIAI